MLTIRIIPCLDVEDGKVVKGISFKDIRYAGDPVELAKRYNDEGADEIIFLDIAASYKSRKPMLDIVEKVSKQVFIPLTVGGGIRDVSDMRMCLNAGADKVSICSAALKNPELLTEGAEIFGSQCIVLSIDAKKNETSWQAYIKGGRENFGIDAIEWAKRGEELGAGELLLNSIDADGRKAGYDLELTAKISESGGIPAIASGGAGTLEHILDAINKGKADAALVASILHYGEYSIQDIKQYLKAQGIAIR